METYLKNGSFTVAVLVALVAMMIGSSSCAQTPQTAGEASVNEAMVQVWSVAGTSNESGSLESFGIAVGDGSQVLTFLDYESYTPGNLDVVTRGQARYSASVQAIDPRTGVTLLKLKGTDRLPAVALDDVSLPEQGQVRIWGWTGPDYSDFESSPITVSADQAPRPLFFSVEYEGGFANIDAPGAVVTDKMNHVLGLETTFHERLAVVLGPMGRMPAIASITSGIELLSPDATHRSWVNGPAVSLIANRSHMSGYFAGVLPSPSDYEKMTLATQNLLGRLGEPTATDDLHFSNDFWYQSLDGTLLVLVYPRPVDLRSSDGKLLAQAKWVGIEWGRDAGLPNRLVYGVEPYNIQGGFILLGDVVSLQQSVPPAGSPSSR